MFRKYHFCILGIFRSSISMIMILLLIVFFYEKALSSSVSFLLLYLYYTLPPRVASFRPHYVHDTLSLCVTSFQPLGDSDNLTPWVVSFWTQYDHETVPHLLYFRVITIIYSHMFVQFQQEHETVWLMCILDLDFLSAPFSVSYFIQFQLMILSQIYFLVFLYLG